jgi:hypothetical protein
LEFHIDNLFFFYHCFKSKGSPLPLHCHRLKRHPLLHPSPIFYLFCERGFRTTSIQPDSRFAVLCSYNPLRYIEYKTIAKICMYLFPRSWLTSIFFNFFLTDSLAWSDQLHLFCKKKSCCLELRFFGCFWLLTRKVTEKV